MASTGAPASSGGAALSTRPRQSTVTRSMSRRSLATVAEDDPPSTSTAPQMTYTASELPSTGMSRSRTATDLASSASLPRARSTASIAARSAVPAKKLSTSGLTSSRSRRVLAESNLTASSSNRTASSASSSTSRAVAPNGKPAAASRRYSRTEAGRMTGMGVVRAGPAVQGQRSPRKLSSVPTTRDGGANDPFSTAFVRPTFDFEAGGEREVRPLPRSATTTRVGAATSFSGAVAGVLAAERAPLAASSNPFDLTSPQKRAASSTALSSRSASSRTHNIFGEGSSAMDVDDRAPAPVVTLHRLAIPPSSPVRGALSPRSLTGRTALTRKLEDIESDSDDDDIDFLSPRKKAAKRIHLSAPSPVASASSAVPPFVSKQADEDATIHAHVLPRSPPPKKRAPQLPVLAGSVAPMAKSMPTSVPMQRGGRTFPLPNLSARPSASMPPPLIMPRPRAPVSLERQEDRTLSMSSRVGAGVRPLRLAGSVSTTATASATPGGSSRLPRPSRVPVVAPASVHTSSPHRVTSPPPPPPPSTTTDDSMAIDADVSMCSVADVSMVSTASTTSTRSEETARRLANLQSMLSRLQMPKPSVGVTIRRTGAESAASVSMSRDYEVPLAPAHEPVVTRRSSLPRSRASLPSSVVAPPPPTSSSHVAPLLPSGPTARRKSSAIARPAGGIVDTSSSARGADVSMVPSSSSALAHPPARRISSTTLPSSASMSLSIDAAGTAALSESVGRPKVKGVLQGVVACVDVRTAEGDDSGMVFVDLLKGLGARVTARPSTVTTHIIFKSGRPSTLQFHRSLAPSARPHLVGIAWVVRCAELGAHADETPFKVEDAAAPLPGTGKENAVRDVAAATAQAALGLGSAPSTKGDGAPRRRKSMEPKALAALGGAGDASFTGGPAGAGGARDAALKASIAASIERARRKSLQFMPKVGSPLARRVFVMPDAAEEDKE